MSALPLAGWLVESRVPLYYSIKFGAVIPHTGEPADCALLYGGPEVRVRLASRL